MSNYQLTLDEYIDGDIEYKPRVETHEGGRKFYICPVCGACVGGITARGEVWFAMKGNRCKNGHKQNL